MDKKIIKYILIVLLVFSLIITTISIIAHIKKEKDITRDNNSRLVYNYKRDLIFNLNKYIKDKNIDITSTKSINSNDVINSDLCSGNILFDKKADLTLYKLDLKCNVENNNKQNIFGFKMDENIELMDLIKIDNGFFLISQDSVNNINYISLLDENFSTKWKEKIEGIYDNGLYTYKTHIFKSNKYYIALNYSTNESISKKNMAILNVDKNSYNLNTFYIPGNSFDDLYKMEFENDSDIVIYDSSCYKIKYDTKNKIYDILNIGHNLDYDHEKLIGILDNTYYTYDHVFKTIYKYKDSENIIKEVDLKNIVKDKKIFILNFNEFKPFIANNRIFIGYQELDKNNKYTQMGILILDLDFNLIKDISFNDVKYDLNFMMEDKSLPKTNIIKDGFVNDNKLYIYSIAEFKNTSLPIINEISLDNYKINTNIYSEINKNDDNKILKKGKNNMLLFNKLEDINYLIEYNY